MSENGQREFAPRGPVEVAQFLDVKSQELAQLEVELQQAHELLEQAEEAWMRHYDEICEQLGEDNRGKVPGEDLRISAARRGDGWALWTTYRHAERLVKRMEKSATIIGNVISACQSEAKLLRATSS